MVPRQTFHDHIKELRRRLMWVVLAIGITAGISYAARNHVTVWLQRPLHSTLYYTSPSGSFNFILKLSTIIGLFVALPVIIYNLIRFLEPALPKRISKKLIASTIGSSFFLALCGAAFGYFYMIPVSLKFFAGYATPEIRPLISANEYLSYLLNNVLLFALVFQIPLVILFIDRIKPFKPSKLLRYQRHVIVGAFGLAVVLPFTYDPVSQFIVAIPIIFLFYLSVVLLWIANRRHKPRRVKQKQTAPRPIFTLPTPQPSPHIANLPTAAVVTPVASFSSSRPRAIDGFAYRPQAVLPAHAEFAPRPVEHSEAPAAPIRPAPIRKLGGPSTAIDGVSPFWAHPA